MTPRSNIVAIEMRALHRELTVLSTLFTLLGLTLFAVCLMSGFDITWFSGDGREVAQTTVKGGGLFIQRDFFELTTPLIAATGALFATAAVLGGAGLLHTRGANLASRTNNAVMVLASLSILVFLVTAVS